MEKVQNKAQILEARTLDFSVNVIQFLQNNPTIPKPVASQLIRSATSVGANYAEANNASSKQDFRNKIYIAKKEASETRYWLRIIERLGSVDNAAVESLLLETQELIMILQKIVSTINNGSSNEK